MSMDCPVLFVIVLCLWPVFPMSLDWPDLFVIVMCLVNSVANVYGLSSLVCDRSVSCAQCCQCLWIVQSCLWSFCVLCPVLPISLDCSVLFVVVFCLVPSVAYISGLTSLVCDRSLSCAQCCLCLWIVQSCLWSFCVLCPVLPISLDFPVLFVIVLCLGHVVSMSLDCPVLFVIVLCLVPSVNNVSGLTSLACDRSVSCSWCCQCLCIVQSCL